MILTSTTQAFEFRIPWREDDEKAPVFYLRAGSVIERGQMEAEIDGPHRAALVHGFELRAAVRSGLETIFAEDAELPDLLELFEQELAHEIAKGEALAKGLEEPADPVSADGRRTLRDVRNILTDHWPDYRELVSQAERRRKIAPIEALRRFCVNITGHGKDDKPIVFSRGRDGMVSEATLAALPEMEMLVAGNRAFGLQYGSADAKNSQPPSSSDDGQETSSSAAE